MKPLNQQARNSALVQFTSFYILIISIAGAMIYLTAFTAPAEDTKAYLTSIEQLQQANAEVDSLSFQMDSLTQLLTDLKNISEEIEWNAYARRIAAQVVTMDNTWKDNPQSIFQSVLSAYQVWTQDKEQLWLASSENQKLTEELEECKEDASKAAAGGAGDDSELSACKEKLAKKSNMARDILSYLKSIEDNADKLKGLRDRKDKEAIKKDVERIRTLANRIQY